MAKIPLVACNLLFLCALVHGLPPIPECATQSDCAQDQCCLNGRCSSLGSAYSGCSTVVYIREPDVYSDYCPCDSRLHCQGNPGSTTSEGTCRYWSCKSAEDCQTDECCSDGLCRLKSSGACRARQRCSKGQDCRPGECCYMEKGVCLSAAVEHKGYCEMACSSEKDCDQGYCCQATSMLKGRKRRATSQGSAGSCKPYGNVGSQCVIEGPSTGETQHMCPCQKGLTCQDGVYEIPLLIGTCKASETK